jgi:phage/plasmid primase-like uncharacterized protein
MSFTLFARAHGVEIGDLYPSERIQRCATTDKPRSKNGAFFWDGYRGWVFAWDGEAKVQWYEDPNAQAWTEVEKAVWRAKRKAVGVVIEQGQHRAALVAAEMLRSAKPNHHNYLHIKGFPDAQGFVTDDGALLVPMRSLMGELQGVQAIRWIEVERAYEKKMQPAGMKAKGAVFRMGDKTAPETFLCEGYATGLSIHAALRSVGLRASVLVCFSANNLVTVSRMVRGKTYVFADNDKSQAGEKAAIETNLPYCMSPVVGDDANDIHVRAGLMAVCQQLMAVRRMEQAMA